MKSRRRIDHASSRFIGSLSTQGQAIRLDLRAGREGDADKTEAFKEPKNGMEI
jgi:hypothetical protein